jgi:hypothetical protein
MSDDSTRALHALEKELSAISVLLRELIELKKRQMGMPAGAGTFYVTTPPASLVRPKKIGVQRRRRGK